MPAYRAGATLAEALRSVFAQSFRDFEVVLVDDASPDDTPRVAAGLADPRLRSFRNERNLGGYQTMNRALGLARGELLAIYHADDVYEPSIVEKEVAFLDAQPQAGAVFCLDHYIDAEGRIWGGTRFPSELAGRTLLRYEDVFPFLLRRKNALLRCPTFMARRSVLEEVGDFDAERYDIEADLDLWIRILRRHPIGVLDERLMRYRVGREQWTARYQYLRTEPQLYFAIMDRYLAEDGWRPRLSPDDLVEYAFHRCDDESFRAANQLIRGEAQRARELLAGRFPWRTLRVPPRRRKLRVLLLRGLMRAGLALGAVRLLGRALAWTEYGGGDPGRRVRRRPARRLGSRAGG